MCATVAVKVKTSPASTDEAGADTDRSYVSSASTTVLDAVCVCVASP